MVAQINPYMCIFVPACRTTDNSDHKSISQLPKLCVKITIFMQRHVLIADWSVAHFVVIMNDSMNDNMAAFAHVGARLGAFFYWTRFLENNVPFDNIPL